MLLLYVLCGFGVFSSGVLGWYWHRVGIPPPSIRPQSQPRIIYEVNACKVGSTKLLVPQAEWISTPTSLLINGCIYTIKTTERSAEFIKLTLDQSYMILFSEGLQDIAFDKWFKLHLLQDDLLQK
jgi:hypothetical protein